MSRLLGRPESAEDWHRLARQLIRMHMTMLGWRFEDLARALAEIGVEEDFVLLRNRIGLGRFRASLFLQCMMAMGVDEIRLPLIVDPANLERTAAAGPTRGPGHASDDDHPSKD